MAIIHLPLVPPSWKMSNGGKLNTLSSVCKLHHQVSVCGTFWRRQRSATFAGNDLVRKWNSCSLRQTLTTSWCSSLEKSNQSAWAKFTCDPLDRIDRITLYFAQLNFELSVCRLHTLWILSWVWKFSLSCCQRRMAENTGPNSLL